MNPTKLAAVVMLASLMLNAGLQIDRGHLKAVLKNYGLLGRALLANFVIVPILGVLLVRIFHLNAEIATGFLLMAIAPGVPFVVQAAGRKKGGSLGFAVALAFIMPFLSILTVPLTAELVLPATQRAQLPLVPLVTSLVLFQLLPLLLGMVLTERAPTLAAKLGRPLMLVFLATVLALVVLLGPTLAKAVGAVYGSRGMWAMLVIVVLSIATGWTLGGPNREYRRTLGLATALRNIGLGSLVATTSFPGTRIPATVLTYLLIQFIVCTIVGVYFTRTARPGAADANTDAWDARRHHTSVHELEDDEAAP